MNGNRGIGIPEQGDGTSLVLQSKSGKFFINWFDVAVHKISKREKNNNYECLVRRVYGNTTSRI